MDPAGIGPTAAAQFDHGHEYGPATRSSTPFKARAIDYISDYVGTTRRETPTSGSTARTWGDIDLHRTTTQAQAIVFSAAALGGPSPYPS